MFMHKTFVDTQNAPATLALKIWNILVISTDFESPLLAAP